MTLSEYFSALSEFLLKNPSLGGCKVVYSGDDEGNRFHHVSFGPSFGVPENGEDWSPVEHPGEADSACIN